LASREKNVEMSREGKTLALLTQNIGIEMKRFGRGSANHL
jgi:hypothetical protein